MNREEIEKGPASMVEARDDHPTDTQRRPSAAAPVSSGTDWPGGRCPSLLCPAGAGARHQSRCANGRPRSGPGTPAARTPARDRLNRLIDARRPAGFSSLRTSCLVHGVQSTRGIVLGASPLAMRPLTPSRPTSPWEPGIAPSVASSRSNSSPFRWTFKCYPLRSQGVPNLRDTALLDEVGSRARSWLVHLARVSELYLSQHLTTPRAALATGSV